MKKIHRMLHNGAEKSFIWKSLIFSDIADQNTVLLFFLCHPNSKLCALLSKWESIIINFF